MIHIDGSYGEGGGQILRSSLALSLITQRPFTLDNIRAGRKRPGLMRQHLTCVRAAQTISNATVEGDSIGSSKLVFRPNAIQPGTYRFAVGTAGSAALVYQAVLPALLTASEPSTLTLEGGTHADFAPTFDFIEHTFVPMLNRMGADLSVELQRYGFYPAGGGQFTASITPPSPKLQPLHLRERGDTVACNTSIYVASLPDSIGHREREALTQKLSWDPSTIRIIQPRTSRGPGNTICIKLECEHITTVFSSVGSRGVRAENVALDATNALNKYLAADVPVGTHLADQLLIPLALAGEGSFITLPPTLHTRTNMETVQTFFPHIRIDATEIDAEKRRWLIEVQPN